MSAGHIHRGLPPTPTHAVHVDSSRPPPCPREMYSQGMYASIEEQDQMEYRRQAPPPPRRNPETRLSTASVSSTSSSGTYDEVHVEETSPHHHHHHHGDPTHHQHADHSSSPRHTTHGSPASRSRFSQEPQSPQSPGQGANRPFSYGAALILSPKLKHAVNTNGTHGTQDVPNYHPNGNSQQNPPQVLQNYQYEDAHSAGSPAASYGKCESVFHPQPHRPPPQGPPPPPPPGAQGQGYYPTSNSPHAQRHSVATVEGTVRLQLGSGSPRLTHKLSQRSQSVPNNENVYLPAPPPPVSVRDGYLAAAINTNRPPSPPLPPPPPEMLQSMELQPPPPPASNVPQQSMQYTPSHQGLPSHHVVPVAPPAVPKSYHQPPPPPPPLSSIPRKNGIEGNTSAQTNNMGHNSNRPTRGGDSGIPTQSPPRTTKESSPGAAALLLDLNKVHLRKTGLKTTTEESAPQEPSPPPLPQEQVEPPSTGPPPQPQIQVSPTVNLFEKKVELVTNNNKTDNRNRNRGDTSQNSNMDIDDIDLNEVPGYTPITRSTPIWKRDMIEKKNQEKVEEYIAKKQKEKEEANKWKHVPAWKRKLMMEKAKEQEQKGEQDQQKAAEEAANQKRRSKEAEEERKLRIKREQDQERQMMEELEDVPSWKREIMMKKGGAMKNWGDERADINDQELQDGDERISDNVPDATQTKEPMEHKTQSQPRPLSTEDSKLEQEWDSLPAWKKEIMMKRGGAIKNWGDENEKDENGEVNY